MLANYVSTVSNYNSSVPESLSMINISLKNWIYNDHVVFPRIFLKKLCWFPINRLCKFTPPLLPGTKCKWHHPCFLGYNYMRNNIIFFRMQWTVIIKISLNLMSQLTCKHNMLTPEAPAESMIGFNFWKIALFWSNKGAVVGRATEFWMRPTLTTRGSRTNSLSASKEKAWKF